MSNPLRDAPPSTPAPVVPVLAGPTAVGKTALSLALAERLGAEIVSADSRQVFRRLDVGTAKPTREERRRVLHHFIDERPLDAAYSAGRFAEDAWRRCQRIVRRGRRPLIVGGSTLYLQALMHGIADVPPIDPGVRAALVGRLEAEGPAPLYAELTRVDPAAAATMDPTKTQRLVRALEVFHGTGRPLSEHQRNRLRPPYRFRLAVLTRPRDELYARIEARVEAMLRDGLLDEVRGLVASGVRPDAPALRTIGYQEPIAHLTGSIDHAEMVRLIKRNSRRYAKRQLTWFRNKADGRAIPSDTPLEALMAYYQGGF